MPLDLIRNINSHNVWARVGIFFFHCMAKQFHLPALSAERSHPSTAEYAAVNAPEYMATS